MEGAGNLLRATAHCGLEEIKKFSFLDISCFSQNLTHTSVFIGVPNIQRLNYQGCRKLHELHPSIGGLKKLIQLNLKDCKRLENLPHELNLESLEILILSGCSKTLRNFQRLEET